MFNVRTSEKYTINHIRGAVPPLQWSALGV